MMEILEISAHWHCSWIMHHQMENPFTPIIPAETHERDDEMK